MINFFNNITSPREVVTAGVSSQNKVQKQNSSVSNIEIAGNKNNTYSSQIEHSNAQPLSDEQKAEKQKANQKQLDEVAKMKRAGKTIESSVEGAGGSTLTLFNTYDKNGDLKLSQTKRDDGSISFVAEYENGKQISGTSYFPEGDVASKMEFKDGKPIKETNYSPYGDGTVTSSVDYEYYSNGNLKSKYEKSGYTYTQNLYYENGKLKSTITPTCTDEYNEAGKLVKTISSPADKDVTPSITYYEYDSDGRKILETEYEKDGKTLISKAETQYTDNKECTIVYDKFGKETFRTEDEKMPDGSIISREDNKFSSRIKYVNKDICNPEYYNYTEKGDLIAYVKGDNFYDANGNEISDDEYSELIEAARAK